MGQGDVDHRPAPGSLAFEHGVQHLGEDLVAGLEVDHRRPALHGRPVALAGQVHEAAQGLDRRVVAGDVAARVPHGGDRAPDQVLLDRPQALVVDPEGLVARRHRVRAEHVHPELGDQPPQDVATTLVLEVEGDRLLPDVRGDVVAAAVGPRHGPADVAVGIAPGRAPGDGRRLDANHAPAEVHEAQGSVRHAERLLEAQDDRFLAVSRHRPRLRSGSVPGRRRRRRADRRTPRRRWRRPRRRRGRRASCCGPRAHRRAGARERR